MEVILENWARAAVWRSVEWNEEILMREVVQLGTGLTYGFIHFTTPLGCQAGVGVGVGHSS